MYTLFACGVRRLPVAPLLLFETVVAFFFFVVVLNCCAACAELLQRVEGWGHHRHCGDGRAEGRSQAQEERRAGGGGALD